jgi:hypothetical protein
LFFLIAGVVQSRQMGNTRLSVALTLFCFSLYVFVTGLRWKTGTDWLPYENAFNLIQNSSSDDLGTTFEPGYLYLMKIASAISANFSVLLVFQSLAIAYFVFRTAKFLKLPPVMFLASLLIAQSQFWYPVRQQIAISIIAFAFSGHVVARKPRILVLLTQIFAAAMMHISSLIALLALVFIRNRHRLVSTTLALLSLALLFILMRESIFELIYSRVGTYIIENAYETESGRLYLRIAERVCSFIISLYLIRVVLNRTFPPILSKAAYILISFGFFISLFSLLYFPYMARVALYFNWAEAVVFAGSMKHASQAKLPSKVVLAIWFLLFWAKFVASLYSYWDLLDPYYFIFEDMNRDVY